MEIEYGYCHCGCRQKTNISTYKSKDGLYGVGEPRWFLHGHFRKGKTKIGSGEPHLCECGCGMVTLPVKKTDRQRGTKIGQYRRFVKGHFMTIYR